MNEVVAGSPINFLDQVRNIFVVDGRGESTHKPPTQFPLAVMRLLPPLIVVSAVHGGCNTTGSLPSTGSSEPGADEAADPASTLVLVVADPATPLLVALGFPSKPLIVLLDHAERGVGRCGGRCMGRCRGVSLSSRKRGSTEKEPEEPERAKTKERTRKEQPVLFGRYQVYTVPFRRYPVSAVPFGRYPVLAVPVGRYREVVVLFGGY